MPSQPPRPPIRPQNQQNQQNRYQGNEQRLSPGEYTEAMRRKAVAKRKAQEKKRRMYIRRRIIFGVFVLALIVGIVFAVRAIFFTKKPGAAKPNSTSQSAIIPNSGSSSDASQSASQPTSDPETDSSQPSSDISTSEVATGEVFPVTTLANANNPIPAGYVPDTENVDNAGHAFDKRASAALKKMIKEGNETGLQLMICSAYRSNERQTKLFNDMKNDYIAKGMSEQEAYDKTKTIRAVPGTSEHETGLAADIVSVVYQNLDNGFEKTDEFKWLRANCAKYGFILRYPSDKTSITGVIYEPWHYRYVGVEMAGEIMKQEICLEEYVELNK